MEDLKFYQDKMDKTMEVLLADYGTIRAGRANPHVLDKIKVDYYGTPTPLQQVGNVSVPEARMIVIQPWEKSLLKAIEKAILTSELGINPTNDGNCIRLIFPEMTEDRRKEVAKEVKTTQRLLSATSAAMQMMHLRKQRKLERSQRTS